MEFVGYETCEKLVCTSGKGVRNTNTIIKEDVTKINTNKIYPSSTLGFGFYPHKDTCSY